MYSTKPGLVLGFHGTDAEVIRRVLYGESALKPADADYHWLGAGIYFWEHNPNRAYEFAKMLNKHPEIAKTNPVQKPGVIGAILDLGKCLDFTISDNLKLLKKAYEIVEQTSNLPVNEGGNDMLYRRLDYLVIETIHKRIAGINEFDSVRGVFLEGQPLYPGAGFKGKNHIQICIRNPNCIKGYFLPREIDGNHRLI